MFENAKHNMPNTGGILGLSERNEEETHKMLVAFYTINFIIERKKGKWQIVDVEFPLMEKLLKEDGL